MARLLTANGLLLVLTTAFCPQVFARPGRRDTALAGRIVLCGGPAPGACRVAMLSVCNPDCVTLNQVWVLDGSGRRVVHSSIRKGRFHLELAPGAYTVIVGWSDGKLARKRKVLMRVGKVTRVKFTFAIR